MWVFVIRWGDVDKREHDGAKYDGAAWTAMHWGYCPTATVTGKWLDRD
eukprot:CAMPEP_0113458372 /NCGR_PEP_ID=MMETSP0014_2-20120614/9890_1 /TAXON_ID=2857 /ORGANISM="Nitzschia sp." /LENGTH=47 /DNA_ID=CAMNT_0000349897 /DNA_START=832 /DNA_END=975 /DNA_ORIENTATION=- /assembly_acc=CAM_ASM_000159